MVWHAHVLHTHQYIQDCHSIFDQMFWHLPEYVFCFSLVIPTDARLSQ